jgi:hypothetical protein
MSLGSIFSKGALSEAKLFLKNGIAWRALRSALYWDAVLATLLFSWFSPVPLALVVLLGFVTYFRRCVGLGRLLAVSGVHAFLCR